MERLILCGGGHVSLELAWLARRLEFAVTVVDDRPEFANEDRFPMAEQVICLPFEEALAALPREEGDYWAVLTRGHAYDGLCVDHILRGPYAYVGMIGSRAKVAATRERLLAQGIPREKVDTLHAPIGLPLGGQTPAEVAVSIAAQLVQVRAGRGGAGSATPPGHGILMTIVDKRGSAPRGVGAKMLLGEDGAVAGSIGGGAVEHQALEEARALAAGGSCPAERTYDLSPGAAELGMVCGGTIRVRFEKV